MKALVGAFNQEKALLRDCTTGCGTDGSFYSTCDTVLQTRLREPVSGCEAAGEERVCLLPCCRTVAGQCVDTGDNTGDSHG